MELVDRSQDAVLPPTFGASLRAARLSRNISLDAIAAHTKINRAFFQDLERNDLSKWPTGQFYRESYIRAYAKAVGLNPRDVIDGFRREFSAAGGSDVAAPPAKPRRLTPVTIPIILAATLLVSYSLARWLSSDADVPVRRAVAIDRPAVETSPAVDSTKTKAVPAAPKLEAAAPQEPVLQPPSVTVPPPVDPGPIVGELVITSTPSGARVLVNGIARGTTPLQMQNLALGSYTIRFIYPGLPGITQQVTISPRRPSVQVSATFEAPEPAAGDSP